MKAQRQQATAGSTWGPTWKSWLDSGLPVLRSLATLLVALAAAPAADTFRFVVLGDRTGGAQPGIYEQVWKEAVAAGPAVVGSVRGPIEGPNHANVASEGGAA